MGIDFQKPMSKATPAEEAALPGQARRRPDGARGEERTAAEPYRAMTQAALEKVIAADAEEPGSPRHFQDQMNRRAPY